ncbi:MAG: ABC transporter ATP-binding protein [Clostridia bacterium]|nr:ABC transporter ATP-binding protein [Clostridia bacterium]
MALLTCKDLSLGYEGHPIVENLNFDISSGDYVCIVGENGSGKSTLMKTILGLQPPLEGKVIAGDGFKQTEIGYLPQQTVVQKDFPASVKEIVLSGCGNGMGLRPFYNKEEKKRAAGNIEKMGMREYADKCYRELSGGQQQRVLLARALCATKKMLLLDEPVTGLDPIVTAEIYDIVYSLNRNDGITIVMISHDIEAALRYATKIIHIGKTVFCGTKEKYLSSVEARLFLKGGETNG